MAKKGGIVIKPETMVQQWAHASHRFQLNVWNFEVELAKAAVDIFKQSFDLHRLNTRGSRTWKERKRSYKHEILRETGTMMNSIEWKYLKDAPGPNKGGVRIYTNPNKYWTAARHKGFCYAAVHNAPSGTYTYGNTGRRSIQRQFIGHSTVLDQKMRELTPKIFAGLP